MIRVMSAKPVLRFIEGHNDMSHFTPSHWEVSGYTYWLTDMQYVQFLQFTDPTLKTMVDAEGVGKTIAELMGTTVAQRMERVLSLNPNKSQVWEFNALKDLKISENDDANYIRSIVIFGERGFIVPTPFELYIKVPVLNAVCWFLNLLRRPRVRREIARWQEFVDKMHRERAAT